MITISEFSYNNPRYLSILKRKSSISVDVETTVKEILHNVKQDGDEALYAYMKKYDNVDINEIGLLVSEDEFEEAKKRCQTNLRIL